MYDRAKLRDALKARNMTNETLRKEAGITSSSYYRKLNGEDEFEADEIERFMDVLGLKTPVGIFFRER